ncbi:MAG: hypothetical protein ACE15B_22510 [Bryobacteraceae bacterium]
MRALAPAFPILSALLLQAPQPSQRFPALARLSEEAEVFRSAIPQTVSEETLSQKAWEEPGRLRTRQLVSEYSIALLPDGFLHEVRQVTSVDGRQVRNPGKARETLVRGLRSPSDRTRNRLLDELRRYGLSEPAADVAPLLLLFTKRRLPEYAFEAAGEAVIGAEKTEKIRYRQKAGSQSVMVRQDRRAIHQPLEGEIYCRKGDGLPLRITLRGARQVRGRSYEEVFSVDYAMTPHGFLAPVSAVHRGYTGGQLRVENHFQYKRFQKFAASAEIKFSEVPEPQ